jgi:hypothetical protein
MENLEFKKEKKIILFNKHTGLVVGTLEHESMLQKINHNDFTYKIVHLDENEYYFGDYETGKVYSYTKKPLVYERDLINETYNNIIASYPLYRQINAIIDVIQANDNIKKTESFEKLVKFLNFHKLKLNTKIKYLSADKEAFNFISNEELINAYKKDLEQFDKDDLKKENI